jgi:filamentous hemagglutinin family protein
MTLQSLKLIRQQLTFHYQSKIRLSKGGKIISLVRRLSLSVVCSVALFPTSVVAQITPDNSVPTTVEQTEENMQINGGEREGNNLFHSFDEFSIPEGMEAIFENATDIENIFTRVTGGEVSNIDGILTTQGDANFFFINPNGIVFGDNASLNVGGSFLASTAESVQFEDGSEFSATNPESPILDLTGFPVGLNLGELSGAIAVNGSGNKITSESLSQPTTVNGDSQGLSVPEGKTLGLVGGELQLSGGILTTSGNIELGSVASGTVSLNPTNTGLDIGYEGISNFQDIALSQQSLVNASGAGNNSIEVSGANIKLSDASKFLIQNTGDTSSGNLTVNATESLRLEGSGLDNQISSGLQTESLNQGKAGNISVTARNLVLDGGGRIGSNTYSNGEGGKITINATNSVELLQNRANIINASTYASGNAGSVELSTSQLKILDAGGISSATLGAGAGGNVIVNADAIELNGAVPELNDLSSISAVSFGSGNGGNAGTVTINTSSLSLKEGGTVSTSSVNNADAGNVTVNASEKIEISGQKDNFPSTISSNIIIGLPEVPNGNAGEVTINTPLLNINSGGNVSVENEGTGNAGTLSINAKDINLDNTGSITATASSGNGGNINLNTDRLQIDNESQITTEAGNEGNGGNITINTSNLTAKKNSNLTTSAVGGDGGNINITADTILGLENSDITANAVGGNGGNINITTDLIYGYQARSQTTSNSHFDTRSAFQPTRRNSHCNQQ